MTFSNKPFQSSDREGADPLNNILASHAVTGNVESFHFYIEGQVISQWVRSLTVAVLIIIFMASQVTFAKSPSPDPTSVLSQKPLVSLPDEEGFAGMFAGVSNGTLLAAGGANFVGETKTYYDTIYVLNSPEGQWQQATAKLPRPLGYGVSIVHNNRVICIGGQDDKQHVDDVFALTWDGQSVQLETLPKLPQACSQMCGALVGDVIYIAGGLSSPEATSALNTFWSLNLAEEQLQWHTHESWPGPERFQSVAGSQDGKFYLFSGIRLKDNEGQPARIMPYLSDAYSYDPGKQEWKKLRNLPRPAPAAPSPALPLGQSHLAILGGADGSQVDVPLEDHPGFRRDILVYHTITDTWATRGQLDEETSRVTAPTAQWNDDFIVVSGERKPRHRSSAVFHFKMEPQRIAFGFINWTVLGLYLLLLLAMGYYFSRRGKGTDDFFVAGRRIPWWAAGLSIYGTQLSAITFMSVPAIAFVSDWSRLLGNVAILSIAPLVIYLYLPFYRRLNIVTAYEYLEKRFNLAVRLVGSVTFIFYHLGRMGIVLLLPAIALSTVTGMNVYLCVGLMGVVCIVYTVLGGIEAVIWTDVLQVIVLTAGALFCLILIASEVGGFGQLWQMGTSAQKTTVLRWGWDPTMQVVWVILIGQIFFNLIPYTSDQTVVQRYLTTPTEKQAANGIWVNGLLAVPTGVIFFGLGTALYFFFQQRPELLVPGRNDAILPEFIVMQMPVGVAGLVIAGVFAASMSSVDSSMNSIATAGVTDFYRRFNPDVSDDKALSLAKWLTALVGILGTGTALWMASLESRSLFDQFIQVMSMIGGGLAGVFILGMFTQQANGVGALVGLLAGTGLTLIVKLFTPMSFFLYAAVGIVTCIVIGYLVSLLVPSSKSSTGYTWWTLSTRGG